MFQSPSLMKRIAIGKMVGLIIGLIGFLWLYFLVPGTSTLIYWGVILWYTTLGAIIGVFGVFTSHPVLHLPLPWWVRSAVIGGWMNFVLTFFAYDIFQTMMIDLLGEFGKSINPFWFIVEGAIVGLIIGYLATRFGGEGEDLPIGDD